MPNNHLNELELRSEAVQDIMNKPPAWLIRSGNNVIFIIVIGLFALAFFVKYPDVVVTEVQITTAVPPQKVIARTSGTIQYLLVENQAIVNKDEALAILSNTADYQEVFALKVQLDSIEKKGWQNLHSIKLNHKWSKLGDIQPVYLSFQKDVLAYSQHQNFQPFSNEKTANQKETNYQNQRYQITQNQLNTSIEELKLKQIDLNRSEILFNKGVVAKVELEQKQLEFLSMQKQVQSMKNALSQIQSSGNDLNKQDTNIRLQESREETQLYKNMLFALQQLKKAISDWELQYLLKSDMTGTVNFMQIWSSHQAVQSGDIIFSIIPSKQNQVLGIAKATPQNIGKVKVGQKVWVKIDNYPEQEFGMLSAQVKTISMTPDHEGNWHLQLKFPNGLTTTYNKNIFFQQEMSGQAEVVTEDLRLIDRFFYPFKKVVSQSL
jgi:multidrug resistance efflux pump